jgi:hypothetical protein
VEGKNFRKVVSGIPVALLDRSMVVLSSLLKQELKVMHNSGWNDSHIKLKYTRYSLLGFYSKVRHA